MKTKIESGDLKTKNRVYLMTRIGNKRTQKEAHEDCFFISS